MQASFRIRFKLPPLADGSQWAQMWNQITREEAEIAEQIWNGMNRDNQDLLRHSQVIPDLLQILADSRNWKKWTKNPTLPMLSYAYIP
jgi:hypothetical protein